MLRLLDLRLIGDTDWQRAVKPLLHDVVYLIARTLAGGCFDGSALKAMLDDLHCDARLIVVQWAPHERARFILYPCSVLAVLLRVNCMQRQRYSEADFLRIAQVASGDETAFSPAQPTTTTPAWKNAAAQLGHLVSVVAGGAPSPSP